MSDPKKVPNRGMGRPKGATNRVGRELRELCQSFTEDAVATLLDIMWTGEDTARIGAAKELLDRGHGKAKQTVEHSADAELTAAIAAGDKAKLRAIAEGKAK